MNGERKHFVTERHNGKKISEKGDGLNENKAVIFDWAGTTVDYGCFAPLEVFIKFFVNVVLKLQMKKPGNRWDY